MTTLEKVIGFKANKFNKNDLNLKNSNYGFYNKVKQLLICSSKLNSKNVYISDIRKRKTLIEYIENIQKDYEIFPNLITKTTNPNEFKLNYKRVFSYVLINLKENKIVEKIERKNDFKDKKEELLYNKIKKMISLCCVLNSRLKRIKTRHKEGLLIEKIMDIQKKYGVIPIEISETIYSNQYCLTYRKGISEAYIDLNIDKIIKIEKNKL